MTASCVYTGARPDMIVLFASFAMTTLISTLRHLLPQRTVRHLALMLGALALASLAPACKGGGGGGSDPMEGEGKLTQSPGDDELGKAPSTLIPQGYRKAVLSIAHLKASLVLTCAAYAGSPGGDLAGTVTDGTVTILDTDYAGEKAKTNTEGRWEQADFNAEDCIQNLAITCSSADGGTLQVTGLAMDISTRHVNAKENSIYLTGTVTGGQLQWRASIPELNPFDIPDLDGATFELDISKD